MTTPGDSATPSGDAADSAAPADHRPAETRPAGNRRGEAFLELVEVMDRLRSPGGCPWDAEQTHSTLAPYVVEEAYELADAIEGGEQSEIVDELGDVLLQVVFHARVGEDGERPFDVDDVARGIVAKLRRRHPHVFDGVAVSGAAEVETNWDAIKATEKPDRDGPLDGIPRGMPPLERAVKVVARLDRAGLLPDALPSGSGTSDPGADLGEQMLALVVRARREGRDAAAELRSALARLEADV